MGKAYQINEPHSLYFLTFQVVGWADIFSRMVYRDIVIEVMNYCIDHKGLNVCGYVIMTNHAHVIWQSDVNHLSNIVRDFKRETSKRILNEVRSNRQESRREWLDMVFRYHAKKNKRSRDLQFWTHENHAVILNSNINYEQRLNYLHENPLRAGWVEKAEEYIYSSAKNYMDEHGLIPVVKI